MKWQQLQLFFMEIKTIFLQGSRYASFPYLVLSMCGLVGALCAIFMPESLGQGLPETLDEANDLGIDQPFWSFLPEKTRRLGKSDGESV